MPEGERKRAEKCKHRELRGKGGYVSGGWGEWSEMLLEEAGGGG